MQFNNQAVILDISVYCENGTGPLSVTDQPTELEQRVRHPTLLLLPALQCLFFTFTILWTCAVQKRVDLVEVSIFLYVGEDER